MLVQNMASLVVAREKIYGCYGTNVQKMRRKSFLTPDLNFFDGICGKSAGEKIAVAVSKSFYIDFYPILTPIPNFIQIGRKTQKMKIFNNLVSFGRLGY